MGSFEDQENWVKGAVYGIVLGILVYLYLQFVAHVMPYGGFLQVVGYSTFFGIFIGLTYDVWKAMVHSRISRKNLLEEYTRTVVVFVLFMMLIVNSYLYPVVRAQSILGENSALQYLPPFSFLNLPFAVTWTGSVRMTVSAGGASYYCCVTGFGDLNQCTTSRTSGPCDFNGISGNAEPLTVTAYCTANPRVYDRKNSVMIYPSSTTYLTASISCGAVSTPTPGCDPYHARLGCYGGNVYWYDNCGHVTTDLQSSCSSGQSCVESMSGSTKTAYCQTTSSPAPPTSPPPSPDTTIPARVCSSGQEQWEITSCSGSSYEVRKQICTSAGQWDYMYTTVSCGSLLCNPSMEGSTLSSQSAVLATCRTTPPTTIPSSPPTTLPGTTPSVCSAGQIQYGFNSCVSGILSYRMRTCNIQGIWGDWSFNTINCPQLGFLYCDPGSFSDINPIAACMGQSVTPTTTIPETPTTTAPTTTIPEETPQLPQGLNTIAVGVAALVFLIIAVRILGPLLPRQKISDSIRKLTGERKSARP